MNSHYKGSHENIIIYGIRRNHWAEFYQVIQASGLNREQNTSGVFTNIYQPFGKEISRWMEHTPLLRTPAGELPENFDIERYTNQ